MAPTPKQPIRRFDVFAEYNKLKALREGRPLPEAKGYGLWLAKVVAARRFGTTGRSAHERPAAGGRGEAGERGPEPAPEPFRTLGGEPQTDALFDREIVARMGEQFYDEVFAPAIERAFDEGKSYEGIRDSIRRDWKPGP